MTFSDTIYPWGLILFSAASAMLGVYTFKSGEKDVAKYEKIPRLRLLGTILGGLDLIWCAFHAKPLVPESMQNYLIPAALALTWAGYLFLDYILARAFGGLLILLAHYFLFESFALKTPFRPAPEVLFFIMGTFGILICGKPHFLRDIIRKTLRSIKWNYGVLCVLAVYTIVFFLSGLAHLVR